MRLDGDAEHSRRSLEQASDLLESATVLEPSGRVYHLILVHCRLYALDMRCGDVASAQTEMVKIHYWHLKSLELHRMLPEQCVQELSKDSSDHVMEYVDHADMTNNNNRLPQYYSSITNIQSIKSK